MFYKVSKYQEQDAAKAFKLYGMYLYKFRFRKWYNPIRLFRGDLIRERLNEDSNNQMD